MVSVIRTASATGDPRGRNRDDKPAQYQTCCGRGMDDGLVGPRRPYGSELSSAKRI